MNKVLKSKWILICLFITGCEDLTFFEKEQELVHYYNNDFSSETEAKDVYTVLTYNIQMGFTKDQNPFEANTVGGSAEHLSQLVEAINSINPDFVALQDVARNVSHTLIEDQVGYLARELKMNYAYGDYSEVNTFNGIFIRGTRGHAFLTKYKIKKIENIEILNQSRYDSRTCLTVDIEINHDKSISFLATHFRGHQEVKKLQAERILDITSFQENPIIILGDFNATIRSPHLTKLVNLFPSVLSLAPFLQRFNVQYTGTIGTPGNASVIDLIFMDSANFKVIDIGIMEEQYWNLSDHRFLFTSFSF